MNPWKQHCFAFYGIFPTLFSSFTEFQSLCWQHPCALIWFLPNPQHTSHIYLNSCTVILAFVWLSVSDSDKYSSLGSSGHSINILLVGTHVVWLIEGNSAKVLCSPGQQLGFLSAAAAVRAQTSEHSTVLVFAVSWLISRCLSSGHSGTLSLRLRRILLSTVWDGGGVFCTFFPLNTSVSVSLVLELRFFGVAPQWSASFSTAPYYLQCLRPLSLSLE